MYGRTALISSVVSKARDQVKAHYHLKGEAEKVAEDVHWLLEKAHFIFGKLNIKV
jgi:hypothetical protein